MNNNEVRSAVAAVACVAAVGVTITTYVRVHKKEAAKRREIERNKHLDIEAIHNATAVTLDRIARGDFDDFNFNRLSDEHANEIKFQKIAIREEI